jgi:hypothetical protein
MPHEEPAMPEQHATTVQQTAVSASAAQMPAVTEPAPAIAEPALEDEWDEPIEELPPRPRRRLLGVGGNPIPLALLGVLLIACGFIAGALVEKGQTSSSSSGAGAAGLVSRFAALRGASGAGSGASTSTGAVGGGSGATGGATIGQVAYIDGSTLYVTNAEGNTVKVRTSAASTVTKTVKADVKGIHPGETVVVTGTTGVKGEISAESIRIGGGAGGGLGALFDGAGGGRRGGSGDGTGGGGSSGGGEPALFGRGG